LGVSSLNLADALRRRPRHYLHRFRALLWLAISGPDIAGLNVGRRSARKISEDYFFFFAATLRFAGAFFFAAVFAFAFFTMLPS